MRAFLFVSVASVILLCTHAQGADVARIQIDRPEEKLKVRARFTESRDWFELATYQMARGGRPFLHPVHDPSGSQVLTQDRPDDHPWQHGIFTGFHRVNGFNYWKEDQGRHRFVRLLNVLEKPDRVGWTALTELVDPEGQAVLEEENTIVFHAPESTNAYIIDFTLVLRSKDREVQFGKFFVGGLSVRMPWDETNPRQTHLNSEGLRGRAGEQKRAAWCTVERPFSGGTFGFAIFDHPKNTNHPPAWRVDEQGLINPNISGLADWSIPAGAECKFHYQILVYRAPVSTEQLTGHFEKFENSR